MRQALVQLKQVGLLQEPPRRRHARGRAAGEEDRPLLRGTRFTPRCGPVPASIRWERSRRRAKSPPSSASLGGSGVPLRTGARTRRRAALGSRLLPPGEPRNRVHAHDPRGSRCTSSCGDRFRLRQSRSVHAIRVARADVDVAVLLGIALADPVLRVQSSVVPCPTASRSAGSRTSFARIATSTSRRWTGRILPRYCAKTDRPRRVRCASCWPVPARWSRRACTTATARCLVEAMGFKTAATTGAGLSNALLGQPDIGIFGLRDNVDACRHIARTSRFP